MTDVPRLVTLAAGRLHVDLAPEIGAALSRFAYQRDDGAWFEVLRPADAQALRTRDPLGMGCFPLVPFSGRIAQGRFTFAGRAVQLPPNLPPEPHTIHGQGWRSAWRLERHDPDYALLSLDVALTDTPFHYRATQTVALRDDALHIGLSVRNTGDGPMPAGLGLHPWFARAGTPHLRAAVAQVWHTDEAKIPLQTVDVPEKWRLGAGKPIEGLDVDHCFTGWDGHAEIVWQDAGLRLVMRAESAALGHLVVYVPPGADHFCVEPVSHASDAFARLDDRQFADAVPILAPGETFAVATHMAVETA